jgi:sulfite exporter TauE/SafE
MTAILALLTASLLGSVHCAAMCGGFVCVYAGVGQPGSAAPQPSMAAHAAYNLGRLISYTALGLLAGAIGQGVQSAGGLVGVQRGAAILAGLLMLIWAGSTLVTASGRRLPTVLQWRGPQRVRALLSRALSSVQQKPPTSRAATMGLLTTLLPCGWLYTFVVAAGGSGTPLRGAAMMAVFWAGTVPMMLSLGLGAQRLLGPLRQRLPMVTASAVFVLGLLSLTGHMQLTPLSTAMHAGHTGHTNDANHR